MTNSSQNPKKPSIISKHTIVILLVLFASGIRIFGITWGLPHHFHSDEDVMMYWAEQIRTRPIPELTTHQYFYVYSPLPLYWTAAGGFIAEKSYPENSADYLTFVYTWARSLSVLLGSLTVGIVYFAAARIAGPFAGLIAGLLLCCSPLHIQSSRFFTAEGPFTFFAAFAMFFALGTVNRKNYSSALLAGCAIAGALLCKYTAAAYLPALFLCQLTGLVRNRKNPFKSWFYLLLPSGLAVFLFLAFDPWIFINPGNFIRTYNMLKAWGAGHERPLWTAHFNNIVPGWYWLTNLLPTAIGAPAMFASFACILMGLIKRSWMTIGVTIFGVFYFLIVGLSYMQYIRYSVPLLPVLAVLAGVFLCKLWNYPKFNKIALRFAVILIIGFTVFRGLGTLNIYAQTDVRMQAAEFLQHQFPEGTVLVTDNSAYRPPLGSEITNPAMDRNHVLRGNAYFEKTDFFRIKLLDTYNHLYKKNLSPDQRWEYINQRIKDADILVFSEEAIRQYRGVRDLYPMVNKFYDQIFDGEHGFLYKKTFHVRPGIAGLYWDDSNAEMTWRLFDHPIIWVFSREKL